MQVQWDPNTPMRLNVESIPEGNYFLYAILAHQPAGVEVAQAESRDIQNIICYSEELSFLRLEHTLSRANQPIDPLGTPKAAFADSNLISAIVCMIALANSTVFPYYSEGYRNRTLFFPFMLILRAIFCVYDLIFHAMRCLYYLAMFQFKYALGSLIQLLCDVPASLIHIVINLPLACASFILRPIVTLVVGYQEKLLPNEPPRRAIAPMEWRGSKQMDVSLNALVYETRNCFFTNSLRLNMAVNGHVMRDDVRPVELTAQPRVATRNQSQHALPRATEVKQIEQETAVLSPV